MRRYGGSYRSPPRRDYGGRERSPPRRRGYGGGGGGGGGGRRDQNNGSLLVRNIPLNCRTEDLRVPFERFGPVRDVYIPKDYYSGEPRGFAFVQFVDPYDASEAQYHMHGKLFGGREITVVLAAESRKRPEEMRNRDRVRGFSSGYDEGRSSRDGGRSSRYGRSRSRSVSRSRTPRRRSASTRRRSRSYSPVPRRRGDTSVSPQRRESDDSRSPRNHRQEQDEDERRPRSPRNHRQEQDEDERRPHSPDNDGDIYEHVGNGYGRRERSHNDEKSPQHRSPRASVSPPGSRSRSAEISPGPSR